MTKHCNECKQALTFAERWGIRKHVCDEDILSALAYKAQEEHKQYLERKRIQAEQDAVFRAALRFKAASAAPYGASTPKPLRSSSGSFRRVSSSDDTYDYALASTFSPSYSSYSSSDSSSSDSSSSYSSSCDSSSSSSDSGSCSSGD